MKVISKAFGEKEDAYDFMPSSSCGFEDGVTKA
jgi:hypothetical protein